MGSGGSTGNNDDGRLFQERFDNGNTFVIFDQDFLFFHEAFFACEKLNPPGNLASFASVEEYLFVLDMINSIDSETINSERLSYWTGLVRFTDTDGLNANDFIFVDGSPNVALSETGQFPWSPTQPDNRNGNERCTILNTIQTEDTIQNRIIDVSCTGLNTAPSGAICKQTFRTNAVIEEEKGLFYVLIEYFNNYFKE